MIKRSTCLLGIFYILFATLLLIIGWFFPDSYSFGYEIFAFIGFFGLVLGGLGASVVFVILAFYTKRRFYPEMGLIPSLIGWGASVPTSLMIIDVFYSDPGGINPIYPWLFSILATFILISGVLLFKFLLSDLPKMLPRYLSTLQELPFVYYCPSCKIFLKYDKISHYSCPACRVVMQYVIECKECQNWFPVEKQGEYYCPKCDCLNLF